MRSTHDDSRWTRLVEVLCRPIQMDSYATIADALAIAFLAGDIETDELVDRGSLLFNRRWRWIRPLARRVVETFAAGVRPRQTFVVEFILADRGFFRACQKHDLRLANRLVAPPMMRPVIAAASWRVASIRTPRELADWLGVSFGELSWFADLRGLEHKRNHGRLRHYHYRPLAKRFGQIRLIESPKPRLKQIQRRVLTDILDHIPLHDAVHGFRRGRSIKTFAAPHVGRRVVLKIDLQDFFPSISAARIQAIFRTIGYPEEVADLLAGLCMNSAPTDEWDHEFSGSSGRQVRQFRWLYSQPHLPQGAPTSPALANLSAYHLDCRLTGLSRSAAATYTRYADDLAFSGARDFERVAMRFHNHVCATVMEERFTVHHRKTRIMRQGVRQRLAGLVVNERVNVPRVDFDRLKATLTNCIRQGPQSQNRQGHLDYRGHLQGRISFVEMVNPSKGHRLRALFDQIDW